MDKYIEQIKKIVLSFLENENMMIIFFGSRAEGNADEGSDVDIAIKGEKSIEPLLISKIKTRLEESNIPYRVDIIDLRKADKVFVQNVLETGIVWKNFN